MTSGDPSAPWERLAQRDPQYYIDPTLGPGADAGQFREQGRGIVDWAVAWAAELPAGRALEVGCGVGRDTIHLARHFEHVDDGRSSGGARRAVLAAAGLIRGRLR